MDNIYHNNKKKKTFFINFGPQHPAAHGVLRLNMEMQGESVVTIDPHIGFLHRGTEKLLENKTYLQCIPYFDRLDYVSTLPQEHGFILALENLLNISVSEYVKYSRVILDEISRILNHIMCITTHALDIGAVTPFLLGFEERENLLYIYELISGARMHTAYYRVGGLAFNLPNNILEHIYQFSESFGKYLDFLDSVLSENLIWVSRLQDVGLISKKDAISYGFTGPVLRSVGVPWDIRKLNPYENYGKIMFNIVSGKFGDAYSRYYIRMFEMRESLKIIQQCICKLGELDSSEHSKKHMGLYNKNDIINFKTTQGMEELIHNFYFYSKGYKVPSGSIYSVIEAPKGETGVYLVSYNSNKPWRCKIKSPGYMHLQGLNSISKNCLLADVVTNIGTLDIVFGEIDR
jgi:NADH dehydrogenase I D subunit